MTAITADGFNIIATLPAPLAQWLDLFVVGQELYVQWEREWGYVIDLEGLEFMLQSAGVSTFNPLPN